MHNTWISHHSFHFSGQNHSVQNKNIGNREFLASDSLFLSFLFRNFTIENRYEHEYTIP